MGDPLVAHGVAQGLDDVVLAAQFVESPRTKAPVQRDEGDVGSWGSSL